jgi:site-specific DNA-methyltransferase (adenine-specific)
VEANIHSWVHNLRTVAAQVARVLKPAGAFWLNVGDSFSRHRRYGAPPKAMLLGPERLLLALAADGWLVRNKVVWSKTNPMPSQVRDRLTLTWEGIYLLVRSPIYDFDLDAIREPHTSTVRPTPRRSGRAAAWAAGREPGRISPDQGRRQSRSPAREEPGRCMADCHAGLSG